MRINVLGPIEVIQDERVLQLAGQRQRALLATLVLEHGKVAPVDQLVDVLWNSSPPSTARARIQAHVSALRQAIGHDVRGAGGPLLTLPPGYSLRLQDAELDLTEFEKLAGRARDATGNGQPAVASELFAAALALWRGAAFADVESAAIRTAAATLGERRLLALEAKAEADLAVGRYETVSAELRPTLTAHPFRERLRALLMLALYRLGCRADALNLYREGRQLMADELGIEPGPPLRRLHQHILTDDPALQPGARRGLQAVGAAVWPAAGD